MKAIKLLTIILIGTLLLGGCGKQIDRVDEKTVIDLSGKWNDTDSRLVSEEMVSDCLQRPWIDQYQLRSGKRPIVIVGTVVNKTDEHIISETFTKDLEKAFINSGRVEMVASAQERGEVRAERMEMQENSSEATKKQMRQETASDYMMKGVINTIIDREGKKKVKFYQINLELIDTETNQKVWLGDKKIKKYIH